MARTAAVFFDVDFTLIHPGPTLPGRGLSGPAAPGTALPSIRRGSTPPWPGPSVVLDAADQWYDAGLYVTYTRRIIELMGGAGPALDTVARELYDDWAEHQHFSLYDDVAATLRGAARPRPQAWV